MRPDIAAHLAVGGVRLVVFGEAFAAGGQH